MNIIKSNEGYPEVNTSSDISNFSGFENLTAIAGNFTIEGKVYLDVVIGLNFLRSVGGVSSIINNDE